MKLKLDENGHVVVNEGKPVYITDDNKEVAFDAASTAATISRLNGEAKGHREAKEALEAQLKAFEGIADPAAAKDALDKLSKIDAKKLIDAGQVDVITQQAKENFDKQLAAVRKEFEPVVQERDTLRDDLHNEKIGNAFSRSKFIADKLAIPVDMVQAAFGKAFKIEEGKIVAYGGDGNRIFSASRMGEPADFDEALDHLVNNYAHKDAIMKGNGANGGGSGGSGSGARGGVARYSRAEYDAMPFEKQAEVARAAGSGKAEILD